MKPRHVYFDYLFESLLSINVWKLIVGSLVFFYLNSMFWTVLSQILQSKSLFSGTEKLTTGNQYFFVFVAPFLETLVFQYLLLHILLKNLKPSVAVVLSGLLFGTMHQYNMYYMMAAILPGIFFAAIVYAKGYLGNNKLFALLLVYVIHSLNNGFAFILKNL
jgi:membrane protease YdiL (CAAX protease family)